MARRGISPPSRRSGCPSMTDAPQTPGTAVLAAVQLPEVDDVEMAESVLELARLARTLGIDHKGTVTQRLRVLDHGAYLGTGKRKELKALMESTGAKMVI